VTWSKVAELLQRYRHATTLAGAGAIALVLTLATQRGVVRLALPSALRYFVFVFVAVAIVLAVLFTILLVVAEIRAARAARTDAELPRAVAREAAPPTPARPARPSAPRPASSPVVIAPPPIDPERDGGDDEDPSILR
jgi:hypothetical protein